MLLKFNIRNPRRNLPPSLYRKRGESNFIGSFEKVFVNNTGARGIGGRQFALSGFGIADFIWINFSNTFNSQEIHHNDVLDYLISQKMMAFEMKLTDWKKALYQAYRYTYFADNAVVVLPLSSIGGAHRNIALFEDLNVGLWAFDARRKEIIEIYTPSSSSPRDRSAKERAVHLIGGRLNFRMLAKQSQAFL